MAGKGRKPDFGKPGPGNVPPGTGAAQDLASGVSAGRINIGEHVASLTMSGRYFHNEILKVFNIAAAVKGYSRIIIHVRLLRQLDQPNSNALRTIIGVPGAGRRRSPPRDSAGTRGQDWRAHEGAEAAMQAGRGSTKCFASTIRTWRISMLEAVSQEIYILFFLWGVIFLAQKSI